MPVAGREDRGDASRVRFTAPDEGLVHDRRPSTPFSSGGLQGLERPGFAASGRHDQLAAPGVGHAAPGRQKCRAARAPSTQSRGLERIRRIIDAGMDDAAVVRARVHPGARVGARGRTRRTPPGRWRRRGQPADASPPRRRRSFPSSPSASPRARPEDHIQPILDPASRNLINRSFQGPETLMPTTRHCHGDHRPGTGPTRRLLLEKGYEVTGISAASPPEFRADRAPAGVVSNSAPRISSTRCRSSAPSRRRSRTALQPRAMSFVPASWDQPLLTGEYNSQAVTRVLDASATSTRRSRSNRPRRARCSGRCARCPRRDDAVLPAILRRVQGVRPLHHGELPARATTSSRSGSFHPSRRGAASNSSPAR